MTVDGPRRLCAPLLLALALALAPPMAARSDDLSATDWKVMNPLAQAGGLCLY